MKSLLRLEIKCYICKCEQSSGRFVRCRLYVHCYLIKTVRIWRRLWWWPLWPFSASAFLPSAPIRRKSVTNQRPSSAARKRRATAARKNAARKKARAARRNASLNVAINNNGQPLLKKGGHLEKQVSASFISRLASLRRLAVCVCRTPAFWKQQQMFVPSNNYPYLCSHRKPISTITKIETL